jgi:hypothetical protein
MPEANLRFPTKTEIARVVEAARVLGLAVTGVEVGPGFVRTLPFTAPPEAANDTEGANVWDEEFRT